MSRGVPGNNYKAVWPTYLTLVDHRGREVWQVRVDPRDLGMTPQTGFPALLGELVVQDWLPRQSLKLKALAGRKPWTLNITRGA